MDRIQSFFNKFLEPVMNFAEHRRGVDPMRTVPHVRES